MDNYIVQKTQKIISALYLITDLIKDSDVIKWEIREDGISMVSSSLILESTNSLEKDHSLKSFRFTAKKIASLLLISKTSSLISAMNADILIHEIDSLLEYINTEEKNIYANGYILSDTFFSADLPIKDIKGQKTTTNDVTGVKKEDRGSVSVSDTKPSDRKDNIIKMLKKDSNLTIKDFAKVIKDCSEKTIQRELISLVEKGVVKRQGERRWSTYSLA